MVEPQIWRNHRYGGLTLGYTWINSHVVQGQLYNINRHIAYLWYSNFTVEVIRNKMFMKVFEGDDENRLRNTDI